MNNESSELLTVYDENLNPIGEHTREDVHAKSLLHQTVRLWIVQGGTVWFQRRSKSKTLFPGRLDPSVTGHISSGESPEAAVLRETYEEIGLRLSPADIMKIGGVRITFMRPDGRLDNEFANIFLYTPKDIPDFRINSEVDSIVSMDMRDYDKLLRDRTAVRVHTYRCCRDEERPPMYIGYATYGTDDFCCLNAEEWAIVQGAIAMPTHLFD